MLLLVVSAVAALSSASPSPAPSVPASPDIVALLQDPVQLATWLRTHSPTVAAATAHVDAARANVQQARVLPNPELAVGVGGFTLGDTNPVSPRLGLGQTTYASVGLTELIEIGKRGPRQASAQARQHEAVWQSAAQLADDMNQAMQAMGGVVFLHAKMQIQSSNLDDAKQALQLADSRRQKQDISENDYERLQLEVQRLESERARTAADLEAVVAACTIALHAPCTVGDAPNDLLDRAALPAVQALAPALRAEVRAMDAASRALQADASLASARAIPDLTFGVQYLHDNQTLAGSQPNTLMLSLAIPLPLFDRGKAEAASAIALQHETELRRDAAVTATARELDGLLQRQQSLAASLQYQTQTSVPMSHAIVEQTRKAFALGQVSLTELLLAERGDRELAQDVLELRFALFTLRADVRRAAGHNDQVAQQVLGVQS